MQDSHICRRKLMQYSAAGMAVAASSGVVRAAKSNPLPQGLGKSDKRVTTEVEVLVVGGGTAGSIAAIQAALASQKNTTPLKVPLKDIKEMLHKHGAIVRTV